jgi:pyrroline-5-carboxylate reductase
VDDVRTTYGVLGVGSLASAVVTGLCDGVADPPSVLLSPRNAEVAASLAGRFPTVTVAPDNQAVLDGSDVVLICLRRAHVDLLEALTWRPGHVVVSAVAGLPLPQLVEMVAPAGQVARAVPMPAVATRGNVTPIYPPLPAVITLFDRLGGTLSVEDGHQFEAIFTAMGTVAPFYEYLAVLAHFLVDHGVPHPSAHRLVADTFVGVLGGLAASDEPDFSDLVAKHAPPGGGNAQLTELMREAGVFEGMARSLEGVHRRLT